MNCTGFSAWKRDVIPAISGPVVIGTEKTKYKKPRAEGSFWLPTISPVSMAIKVTNAPSKIPNKSVYTISMAYVLAKGHKVVVTAITNSAA